MSTQDAGSFLDALGKDDGQEDGVTRRRRPRTPTDLSPEQAAARERAAQRRTVVEDPVAVDGPGNTPGLFVPAAPPSRQPVPKYKLCVDIPWPVKLALDELCERDRRGPKLEVTDALLALLAYKGIPVQEWK